MEVFVQLILNSIIAGSIYAMIALGFNLIFGTVKFLDIGYGAFTAIGGYAVFYFGKTLGLNIFLSAILGMLISGLIGFLIYKLVYQNLINKKASSMVLMVASLGVLTALQAILAILFTTQFWALSGLLKTVKLHNIFGGVITSTQVTIIFLSFFVMLVLALTLKFTLFGKAVRAISDDIEISKINGINTGKIIGIVFFIGTAIASLAGILFGLDSGIEPTMGLHLLLKGVIASIIGGIGNVYGGVLGAFVLGFVENFGIWKIPGAWKDVIAFAVLILFLLFRPQGILRK